jgi:hypothetical protein
MKKILLFSFLLLISLSFNVYADVIPENAHYVDRCVKFINLDKYPDIILLGSFTGPMTQTPETYTIENNKCLTKGYKFNSLNIYWTTKDKPQAVIEGNKIPDIMDPDGGYLDNSNPLVKETIEYSIAGQTNGKVIVYKSKQTSFYNNGKSDKVEVFKNPLAVEKTKTETKINKTPEAAPIVSKSDVTITPPPVVKMGFWHRFICFLGLSKDC